MSTPSRNHLRFAGASALAMAVFLASVPAHAQTPPAPPPPPVVTGPVLKSVVITARHRAEKAQNVPVSLTVVSADQIKAVGSSNLSKIQELVPTLTVDAFNPRNTALNIRGLGAVPNIANDGLEDGVGVYLDGVLLARPAQAVFDLPDIQNVEVLRGPQGTLFGKNTVSGAVNITTSLPSFTPTASGSVSLGTQNYVQLKAYASSALFGSDKLAASILYQGTQHAGYVHDTYDGRLFGSQNDQTVRAQFLANITPALTVRTIFDYTNEDDNCCATQVFGYVNNYAPNYDGGAALPATKTAQVRYTTLGVAAPSTNGFGRTTTDNSPVHYHQETGGASTQVDYDLNGFDISSITAARYWFWYPHNDSDLTSLSIFDENQATVRQHQFSQELRVTSPLGGRIDYTAGVFAFYQDLHNNLVTQFGSQYGDWVANSTTSASASTNTQTYDGLSTNGYGNYYTQSYAAYGQGTLHILPGLDLTSGLRYTEEYKSGDFFQNWSGGESQSSSLTTTRNASFNVGEYHASTSNGLPSWLETLSYKPVEGVLTYATYSHGAKSAGVNLTSNPHLFPPIVKPETIDNYEIGAKTTLLGGRALLDGDLFWDEDKDYQANSVALNPATGVYSAYIASIPKVRSRGAEVDAQLQATQELSLFASAVYDNAYYESNPNSPCPIERGGQSFECNLTGGRVAGVSTWVGSFGGEYDHELPEISGHRVVAYLTADASLRTGFYSGADDSQYSYVPGYGIGNIAAGFKDPAGRWELSGWVHNFTNTNYYLYRGASGSAPLYNTINGLVGDPITGGVTLSGKF